jgi:hypothetical protein
MRLDVSNHPYGIFQYSNVKPTVLAREIEVCQEGESLNLPSRIYQAIPLLADYPKAWIRSVSK